MTTTRRGYVFATFLSSCAALVLLIVACATNVWISSDIRPITGLQAIESHVNYGLFLGTYDKALTPANTEHLDISLVCDFGENVCAWSCAGSSDERSKELSALLDGATSSSCTATSSAATRNASSRAIGARATADKKLFMNSGLYLSTVIFLMLALLATAGAALLAVFNSASNPSRTWLAVESLYFWNAIAACLDLLVLILWGSHFATVLKENIGLNDVISGLYTSNGLANVGWSYWMVLVALLISLANDCVLFWRDYMIRKEPPPPTYNPEKDAQDGTIMIY